METAHFGVFEPTRFAATGEAATSQKPFFSDSLPLSQNERDIAILTGQLPLHEQEHDRRGDELGLAGWLALMNL